MKPDELHPERSRLDRTLCARGLFASRAQAQAAIEAGLVTVDGRIVLRAGQTIPTDALIEARPAFAWVSRAGLKLEAGLEAFAIDVRGLVALDIGASTGGFTDVLRTKGARRVYALDIGHGQLHPKLRADPGVVNLERLDARRIEPGMFTQAPDLVTCDASFIGLEKVLPAALDLTPSGARLVALFKPQFEVGPRFVGKGGVVKNDRAAEAALSRVLAFLSGRGWRLIGRTPSPVLGTDGNRETLLGAEKFGLLSSGSDQ